MPTHVKHTRVILRSHVCVYVHLKRLTKDAMRSTTCPNVHRCLPSALRNVEQYFSRAGQLSDPNMDAEYLGTLTSIGVNKAVHTSPHVRRDLRDKYVTKYCTARTQRQARTEHPTLPTVRHACTTRVLSTQTLMSRLREYASLYASAAPF